MRGKVFCVKLFVISSGITPAHAGKSCRFLYLLSHLKDHPRTCGEKQDFLSIRIGAGGSPPHMRGKALRNNLPSFKKRITPAHAGKSRTFL